MSLTAISHKVGAPVSSVQGLVNGLVAAGYLDERARTYRLGVAPYFLNLLAGRGVVNRIVHEDLVELHAETDGTTVVLGVAVGSDVVYIDHCSTDPRTAYLAKRFFRRSLIRTSTGWVLLADWEQRDLWAYLETLAPEDEDRIQRFLVEQEKIREDGVAALPAAAEDMEIDGISVPVWERGRVVAAVGVVGPREVLQPRRAEIVDALRRHSGRWHSRG
ncbi:DNA-binding IclR family transcriptional regulator [Prauserella sediminis]|uniref:DNA-binding IclR family transcriptional regulator n=1 Tax=Prauserella sediminis TaxID=577680 RepID=A0A839XVJ2_9PSEU|nr:DNA-binding IclR family transcriptional regulator [Prauserella sediminis]